MSAHIDMNMKPKQTRIEFKQFQILPDWPIIIRSGGADGSLEDASVQKVRIASLLLEEDGSGTRSFVE